MSVIVGCTNGFLQIKRIGILLSLMKDGTKHFLLN